MIFKKYFFLALGLNICIQHIVLATETPSPIKEAKEIKLTLPDLLFQVSERNSTILTEKLQWEMTAQLEKSKEAIFEPSFYSNYNHSKINTPTTAQEQTYLPSNKYREVTENYEVGLKGLLPTGASYKAGFAGIERQSNIIDIQKPYKTEFVNTFTVTITQPLLRDMGVDITATQANIAKINHEIAFYTYRQKIMETAGNAAQAYWRLYGVQQMYKGWEDSLKVAEDLLENTRYQAENGRAPKTEILKTQSAVKLRQAKLTEAQSDIQDAQAELFNLLNISVGENSELHFIISPDIQVIENIKIPVFEENFKTALDSWPPYLITKKKIEIEDIQVNYAENQTLPRLDLVAGNPLNSLSSSRGDALSQTFSGQHISWNAGVQMEMPILGNQKAEAELNAAKLRRHQAKIELEPIKRQLSNNLQAKINRLKNAKSSLALNKSNYNDAEKLLGIEFQRLEMGKSSNDDVLKQEEDVLDKKRNYLSSLVELKHAEALVDIANGSLFDKYNIHIAKSDDDVTLTKDIDNEIIIPDSLDISTMRSKD